MILGLFLLCNVLATCFLLNRYYGKAQKLILNESLDVGSTCATWKLTQVILNHNMKLISPWASIKATTL